MLMLTHVNVCTHMCSLIAEARDVPERLRMLLCLCGRNTFGSARPKSCMIWGVEQKIAGLCRSARVLCPSPRGFLTASIDELFFYRKACKNICILMKKMMALSLPGICQEIGRNPCPWAPCTYLWCPKPSTIDSSAISVCSKTGRRIFGLRLLRARECQVGHQPSVNRIELQV